MQEDMKCLKANICLEHRSELKHFRSEKTLMYGDMKGTKD